MEKDTVFLAINWNGGAHWIDVDEETLPSGQGRMQFYETLWIRGWDDADPWAFIQDIFQWATMFIWVFVTIALIVSGLMLIFAWWDEKMAEKWKTGIYYSIIGLLLVIFSYAIIRVVQIISAW